MPMASEKLARSCSANWSKPPSSPEGASLVLPGCRAIGILRNPGKTRSKAADVSVEFSISRAEALQFQIKSKMRVVAGGELNTPRLLKRSGLKNKHVGKNLHLHPTVVTWGYFPETTTGGWPENGKRSYEGGILTSMASVGVAGSVILLTPALHPGISSGLMPWLSAADFRRRMRRFARTAHMFALVRDEGSGTVNELRFRGESQQATET